MNNLDKKHIEIFREYFLSRNEDVRRNIKSILPGMLLKYLSIIETGFSENSSVENIASQIEAYHLIPELKQLKSDYDSSLDQTFEEELAFTIRAIERESLKKKFESIDLEDEFQINESEIKTAIVQVERESIKNNLSKIDQPVRYKIYVVSTVFIAIVSILFIILYNTKSDTRVSNDKRKIDIQNSDSIHSLENRIIVQSCLNSEQLFYEYYNSNKSAIDPIEGIWNLDNYIESWEQGKLLQVDTILNISSWAIFKVFPNTFKVCDINHGYKQERMDITFVAYIQKLKNKYSYTCNFLRDGCTVNSDLSFKSSEEFEIGYFLPEQLLRKQPIPNKNFQVKWRFKWRKTKFN